LSSLLSSIEARTERLRAPISPEKPAGEDASFDESFERCEAEIKKLVSIDASLPDWRTVRELADELLESRCKDLRLAVWSAVAKTQLSKWEGFAEGLLVCRDLVTSFWSTMFPDAKRLRGRANVWGWLTEQVAAALDPIEVGRKDEEAIRLCEQLLGEIDGALGERLKDAHPGRGRAGTLLRTKIAAIPAPEPEPEPEPEEPPPLTSREPAVEAAPPAPIIVEGLVPPETVADAAAAVTGALEILEKASALLFEADPSSPEPYRLRRVCAALRVSDETPPEGPSSDDRARLRALEEGADALALVQASEELVGRHYAWLDPRRACVVGLTRLGAPYAAARRVVEGEARAYVASHPGAVLVDFADETPAADSATLAWLERESRRGSDAAAVLAMEDDAVRRGFETARQYVADGRVDEGVTLALGMARRAGNERLRFEGELAAAKLAIEAGRHVVARPVLDALAAEVGERRLEEWDPDLCVGLYRTLLVCGEDGASASSSKEETLKKLRRLSPAAASLAERANGGES